MIVSLPSLPHLQLFFNLGIFVVVRLRQSFRSIRKAESGANLKPNPTMLFYDKALMKRRVAQVKLFKENH